MRRASYVLINLPADHHPARLDYAGVALAPETVGDGSLVARMNTRVWPLATMYTRVNGQLVAIPPTPRF